jgi:uncharacterized protein involved in exopolysaccharide biosynthesis
MKTEEVAIMKTEEVAIEVYTRQLLPTSRDVLTILFRQRRAMLMAFAVVLVAAAVSGLWVPKYETQMKIMVRRQRSDAIVTSSANAPSQQFNDQVSEEDLNSEVELLNSEDLLRKVVIATGLSGANGSPTERDSEIRIAKAVRQLSKDLKIEPLRKTNVISVSYQSRDPKMAARVLASLATAYMEKHLEVHRSPGEFKFFDQQMRQYQQGLDQAQAKLTDFTKKTGVVSADLERDSALRQANDFDSAASQARSSLLETEKRVGALQNQLQSMKPRITTVVRTSDNPQLFDQMKSTLLNLELKRTDLLSKFAPTYPLVQEVDQQIAETKSAISAEESKPIRDESSDRDPDYQWVKDELTKAQAELTGLKSRAASASSTAAQYHEAAERLDQNALVQQDLVRAAKTQEENYLLYVHKREEARISDALDQRGIVNVALAEQPVVPALPTKSPLNIAMFTLLLAGIFSLSIAFVVDFMDPSFRTPDELANYLGAPVLAALPRRGE